MTQKAARIVLLPIAAILLIALFIVQWCEHLEHRKPVYYPDWGEWK